MAQTFAIVMDGVLRKPNTEALNNHGWFLYDALSRLGRVAVLCGADRERAEWFLKSNGLKVHAHLIAEDPVKAPDKIQRRRDQLIELRTKAAVEFVVESDPEIAASLLKDGVTTLLYVSPTYTQPSFRPDYNSTARPWDVMVAEVEYQRAMRALQPVDEEEQ